MAAISRLDTVATGDVLLFSNNTPTGFLLKTFVSSPWNHSGIAVRFQRVGEEWHISLTTEGELFVLETNTGSRFDPIAGRDVVGAGFSPASVCRKYNKILVRRLHNLLRTPTLAAATIAFVDKYRGTRFPSSSLPFIGVWLGIPLVDKLESGEMFCSELMAHYYVDCVGPEYEAVTGTAFDGRLATLFGTGSPHTGDMYTPGHYTAGATPNSAIFAGFEETVYTESADLLYTILQPFILILAIALILWMLLPHPSA